MEKVPITPSRKRPLFFAALSVVLAATLVFAFTRSFFLQPLFDAPPLTIALIVHGIFGTAWFALLLGQVWLARSGKIAAHRKLGAAAPWLVLAIVGSTLWVIITNLRTPVTASGLPRHAGFLLQASTTTWFIGFFLVGWFHRSRPDIHKRAMLLATITMMAPAFARISSLFRDGGPPPFDSAYSAAIFIMAMAVYDWRTIGRIQPVTLWGGLGYLIWVSVRQPIAKSDFWASIAAPLAG